MYVSMYKVISARLGDGGEAQQDARAQKES